MPSRRVLVVDDNADAADMMKAVLDIQGHAVEVAYDGGSARRVLSTFTPDIVLLDIGLPDIDGYELARVLRNDPKWRGAYLVAVTGWGRKKTAPARASVASTPTSPSRPTWTRSRG